MHEFTALGHGTCVHAAYLRFMMPARLGLSKDLVVRSYMISLLKFNGQNHPYIEMLTVDSCIVH
jgi:hypothetical protein